VEEAIDLLRSQLRVIGAVTMREISAQQAHLMYGYVWALVDTLLTILGFLILRLVLRGFQTPGMPPATYLLTGALPWFMFMALLSVPEAAIKRNKKLLSLPVVTELDLVIGASVQVFMTYTIVFVLATTVSSVWEQSPFPREPLGIMLLFLAIWVIGVSLGLILIPLDRTYPPAHKFVSFILRFGLFVSSVFLSISKFPTYDWPYLTWNPMLHVEELLRQYWFASYVSPVGRPSVIIEWSVILFTLGLVCERYARTRLSVR